MRMVKKKKKGVRTEEKRREEKMLKRWITKLRDAFFFSFLLCSSPDELRVSPERSRKREKAKVK